VSVATVAGVIAAYNHEEYIEEAVASLVGQVDEVVVVNDASADGTAEILDSMTYSNLRVIHNLRQLGVSHSYNRAVAISTSEILLIQGGDDRSRPQRANVQRRLLANPDVAFTYSLPEIIDGRGRSLPDSVAGEFFVDDESRDSLARLFFGANYICAPSVGMRRADYVRLGGFRPGLDLLQDYGLWLSLAAEGSCVLSEEPVVEYRKHVSNLSREYVGLDSVKRRRYCAELEFIRHRFVSSAGEDTLRRLAATLKFDLEWFAGLNREESVAMIELSHDDKLLVRRGLSYLFEIIGEPDGEDRLRRMKLAPSDLSGLATRADHENYADVSSALAVTRTINRFELQ
jgi:glycosyltransferase involved in cell wall biosynthesis